MKVCKICITVVYIAIVQPDVENLSKKITNYNFHGKLCKKIPTIFLKTNAILLISCKSWIMTIGYTKVLGQ